MGYQPGFCPICNGADKNCPACEGTNSVYILSSIAHMNVGDTTYKLIEKVNELEQWKKDACDLLAQRYTEYMKLVEGIEALYKYTFGDK